MSSVGKCHWLANVLVGKCHRLANVLVGKCHGGQMTAGKCPRLAKDSLANDGGHLTGGKSRFTTWKSVKRSNLENQKLKNSEVLENFEI